MSRHIVTNSLLLDSFALYAEFPFLPNSFCSLLLNRGLIKSSFKESIASERLAPSSFSC